MNNLSDAEVWLRAWCAIVSSTVHEETADKWADHALAEFKKRFVVPDDCALLWVSETDGKFTTHRCKLPEKHRGPHLCACGKTLD